MFFILARPKFWHPKPAPLSRYSSHGPGPGYRLNNASFKGSRYFCSDQFRNPKLDGSSDAAADPKIRSLQIHLSYPAKV